MLGADRPGQGRRRPAPDQPRLAGARQGRRRCRARRTASSSCCAATTCRSPAPRSCVVGRGVTVGRPLGLLLTRRSENATVTLCHTGTRDLAAHVRTRRHRRRRGRRARASSPPTWSSRAPPCSTSASPASTARSPATWPHDVWDVAGWVSPNPGGVGPMTRAMLLSNIVSIAEQSPGADVDAARDRRPYRRPIPDGRAAERGCARYPSTIGGSFYLRRARGCRWSASGIVGARATGAPASGWIGGGAARSPRSSGWCCRDRDAGMLARTAPLVDVLMLTVRRASALIVPGQRRSPTSPARPDAGSRRRPAAAHCDPVAARPDASAGSTCRLTVDLRLGVGRQIRPSSVTASRSSASSAVGGVDPAAGEVVDLEALDDLPVAVLGGDRERGDRGPRARRSEPSETTAIETQSPVGGAEQPVAGGVDGRRRGRGGRGRAAGLDDRGAALGDGRDEVVLDPGLVVDDLGGVAGRRPRRGRCRGTGWPSGCPRSSSS